MLQSMGSQRVRPDRETELNQSSCNLFLEVIQPRECVVSEQRTENGSVGKWHCVVLSCLVMSDSLRPHEL